MNKQILILVLLSTLFGGSSLVSLGNADFPLDPAIAIVRYSMIGASLLILTLMSPLSTWGFDPRCLPLLLMWLLFGMMSIISGLVNGDLVLIRDGFWFLTGTPIIFFNAIPKIIPKTGNISILAALILGNIPYILISFLLYPPEGELMYKGVFANPNQMGFTAATIGISILVLLSETLKNKKYNIVNVGLMFLFGCILGLILISQSRNSLLVIFVIGILLGLREFTQIINLPVNQIAKYLIYTVMTIVLVCAINGLNIVSSSELLTSVGENIQKFQDKDGTSGRDVMWLKAISEASLFGHGSDYFTSNFGLGAHNTLFEILGQTGIITTSLMIGFAGSSVIYTFNYFQKFSNREKYAITPFCITVCFWTLSMNEGMFGSIGNAMTLAYMLSIGMVISRYTDQPQKVDQKSILQSQQPLVLPPAQRLLALQPTQDSSQKQASGSLGNAENIDLQPTSNLIVKSPFITKPIKGNTTQRQAFFPLGFYYRLSANPERRIDALKNIASAGFNCIFASWDKHDFYDLFLDEAERRDIQIITDLKGANVDTVKYFKDKPAAFGWGIADDAGDHQSSTEIFAAHKQIKAIVPQDYTYISVSGWSRKWSKYAHSADLIGGQYYPIDYPFDNRVAGLPNQLISVYHVFNTGRTEADRYRRPVIANLQTFRWKGKGRWPTSKEVYNMSYQALLAGVKGIIFYTYEDNENSIMENPALWNLVKSLVPEIKQLTPVLLNGKFKKLETNHRELLAGKWTYQNEVYLVAINTSSTEVYPIKVEIPKLTVLAKPLFAGRPSGLRVRDGLICGLIQPTDVHIYQLYNR
jgi:hypothetical protein